MTKRIPNLIGQGVVLTVIAWLLIAIVRLPWAIYERQKLADDEIASLGERPALSNVYKLLEAFAVYRNAITGADCRVEVTATPDSEAIALIVAQLSVRTSNCPTFGPFDLGRDPDARARTMNGMKPGLIIFHAAKDDQAAHNLFGALANVLPLERSYEVPDGSPERFVWLQFGTGTRWNGEANK